MTTPDEVSAATEYARQRLADELLHRDDDRVQQRRQHALWCAAMTYAERGERVSGDAVLTRADSFLAWLDRAPSGGPTGGTPEPSDDADGEHEHWHSSAGLIDG